MNNHLLQDQWPIKIPQNFYLLKILLLFNKALPEAGIILLFGSMAKWLEHWTCNSEAPSSSPAQTSRWICYW